MTFAAVAPSAAQTEPAPTAPPPAVLASGATIESQNYVLGVGDRLRIIVFGEEALSGEFVIDSSGQVSLPLIGEVAAAGVTVRQFQLNMQAALSQGYLNDPRVSAEVMNFRPFYILGEVNRPGEYPYASNLTVLNAVATAGGFAPLANQTRVFIKHAGEDAETETPLGAGLLVRPGDTIRIAKGAFYILGEVNRPGEYAYSDGLTAMNAVAMAGGFTYRANRGRVFIQRQGALEEQSERLRPNTLVMPGDTIRIGERFF
ncbi:MAG: SLBB domain-containing protein [Hyphomonadaceae bacterium]|nr:SLBB domain-containing protein [Hyphomonadaceae bacterium]